MGRTLTKAEKLLLVAIELEESGHRPFSAEDLVVAAWKRFQDAFALEGYSNYPDSNRVYSEIMGSKPLRKRGWITKTGAKRYQLSDAGLVYAKNIGWAKDRETGSRADISRENKLLLSHLLTSRATRKAVADQTDTIAFPDACSFWNISPRTVSKLLHSRLESVEATLDIAESIIQDKGSLEFTHGGQQIGSGEIDLLREIHNLMLQKFDTDLDVIRARKDERIGL